MWSAFFQGSAVGHGSLCVLLKLLLSRSSVAIHTTPLSGLGPVASEERASRWELLLPDGKSGNHTAWAVPRKGSSVKLAVAVPLNTGETVISESSEEMEGS